MMRAMGIPVDFETTQGQHVEDERSNTSGLKVKTTRTARQYMNRRGGFNRCDAPGASWLGLRQTLAFLDCLVCSFAAQHHLLTTCCSPTPALPLGRCQQRSQAGRSCATEAPLQPSWRCALLQRADAAESPAAACSCLMAALRPAWQQCGLV